MIYVHVHYVGQWILQLFKVDSGKRPHRIGFAVLYWWGQLWTGKCVYFSFHFISVIYV